MVLSKPERSRRRADLYCEQSRRRTQLSTARCRGAGLVPLASTSDRCLRGCASPLESPEWALSNRDAPLSSASDRPRRRHPQRVRRQVDHHQHESRITPGPPIEPLSPEHGHRPYGLSWSDIGVQRTPMPTMRLNMPPRPEPWRVSTVTSSDPSVSSELSSSLQRQVLLNHLERNGSGSTSPIDNE